MYALTAAEGAERWTFDTGRAVDSSPTVVEGTVFVGSHDGHVYALDAGVDGSSRGSRARLGTLGHHDDWIGTDAFGMPGFGFGAALAALGGTGYLLKRRLTATDGDA